MKILKESKGTSGSRYALIEDYYTVVGYGSKAERVHVPLGIYSPDGDGGWFLLQDDALDLAGDFETHVDNLDEETRILMAEAVAEFGPF